MIRKTIVPVLLFGALVVVTVFGGLAVRTALAAAPQQEATPTPESQTPNPDPGTRPGKGLHGGFGAGVTQENLASALGISVDELTTAQQTAWQNALDQAVAASTLTQEQADALASKTGAFSMGGRWFKGSNIDLNALLADALGITTDELTAAYATALNARIDQAVAAGTLTQEQADLIKGRQALYANQNFLDSMKSAYEAAIQQAVAGGVITQAQADQILSELSTNGLPGFGASGGWFGGGRGGHGFGGRFGGRGDVPAPGNQSSPSLPTVPDSSATASPTL